MIERLAARPGLPLTEARDHFAAQGARDALVETSRAAAARSRCRSSRSPTTCAGWAAGPRTGLAEIRLPDLQPGSSIMPGKVNPVLPEAVTQVGAQVIGNDAAVGVRRVAGQLRAERVLPVMARNLLESIRLLANVCRVFADSASPASRPTSSAAAPTPSRRRRSAPRSTRTSATRSRGRDHQGVVKTGRSIREIVLERKLMTDEELDRALDVLALTKGGIT